MAKTMSPERTRLQQKIARISGRIAANARIAAPGYDGREATRAATAARWLQLESQVDPTGELSPEERRNKAKRLLQVQLLEGKLRKAQKQLRKAG